MKTLNLITDILFSIGILIVLILNLFFDKQVNWMPLIVVLLLRNVIRTEVSIKKCNCNKTELNNN